MDRDAFSNSRSIPGDIRDFRRLIETYGGKRGDWRKKSTSEEEFFELEEDLCAPGDKNLLTFFRAGTLFEIHWYELRNSDGTRRFEYKIVPIGW